MDEWFYICLFVWPTSGGQDSHEFWDTMSMPAGSTREDFHYKLQRIVIDRIGLDRFRAGHFASYFAHPNKA